MSKAFTLIELLVVTAIIIFLTALILPNYRSGERQLIFQQSVHKIAQDLRMVQEMATSAKEISGDVPDGFGVHFEESWNYYILFADLNNNHHRDGADQDLETIQLESGVEITDLSPSSSFSVLFSPPDPTVWIDDSSSGAQARITISLAADPANTKTISVNNAGLINVE